MSNNWVDILKFEITAEFLTKKPTAEMVGDNIVSVHRNHETQ